MPKTVIWEALELGGITLVLRGQPGRLGEQQAGHVGVWGRNSLDLGTMWELHFESFSGTEG